MRHRSTPFDDYIPDDLRNLRRQFDRIKERERDDVMRQLHESEAADLRKKIREAGETPCA